MVVRLGETGDLVLYVHGRDTFRLREDTLFTRSFGSVTLASVEVKKNRYLIRALHLDEITYVSFRFCLNVEDGAIQSVMTVGDWIVGVHKKGKVALMKKSDCKIRSVELKGEIRDQAVWIDQKNTLCFAAIMTNDELQFIQVQVNDGVVGKPVFFKITLNEGKGPLGGIAITHHPTCGIIIITAEDIVLLDDECAFKYSICHEMSRPRIAALNDTMVVLQENSTIRCFIVEAKAVVLYDMQPILPDTCAVILTSTAQEQAMRSISHMAHADVTDIINIEDHIQPFGELLKLHRCTKDKLEQMQAKLEYTELELASAKKVIAKMAEKAEKELDDMRRKYGDSLELNKIVTERLVEAEKQAQTNYANAFQGVFDDGDKGGGGGGGGKKNKKKKKSQQQGQVTAQEALQLEKELEQLRESMRGESERAAADYAELQKQMRAHEAELELCREKNEHLRNDLQQYLAANQELEANVGCLRTELTKSAATEQKLRADIERHVQAEKRLRADLQRRTSAESAWQQKLKACTEKERQLRAALAKQSEHDEAAAAPEVKAPAPQVDLYTEMEKYKAETRALLEAAVAEGQAKTLESLENTLHELRQRLQEMDKNETRALGQMMKIKSETDASWRSRVANTRALYLNAHNELAFIAGTMVVNNVGAVLHIEGVQSLLVMIFNALA